MIALVGSELHRMATVRSSRASLAVSVPLAALVGWVNIDGWSLLVWLGAFAFAVMVVAQHHQHRTAVLLYLARPGRLPVLAGQVITAVLVAVGFAATSGVAVLARGEGDRYANNLIAVSLTAVLGAAVTAVVRRPAWLFLAVAGWIVLAEGLLGRLSAPLPFSALLGISTGDRQRLLIAVSWAVLALLGAAVAVHRDVSGD
ncbi:hypothetical protein [Plantactinospora sp. GCM10030261]|uniref:hypothetical protein n=1 Tax=Plantactinospora sp. GCM10030261 TaxID=3273420 RepID=UPI0036219F94